MGSRFGVWIKKLKWKQITKLVSGIIKSKSLSRSNMQMKAQKHLCEVFSVYILIFPNKDWES